MEGPGLLTIVEVYGTIFEIGFRGFYARSAER